MTRTLDQLHRLRAHQRREATVALRDAEAELARQDARVEALASSMARARAATNLGDPADVATWSSWRLQAELTGRRERARLAQKARDVELAGAKHRRAVMDELALAAVRDARLEAEMEVVKRSEAVRMDAIAARGRRAA
jgi:hypothetical protein